MSRRRIPDALFAEIEELADGSSSDLNQGIWSVCDRHVATYNRIVARLARFSKFEDVMPLRPVARSEKSVARLETAQKAKLSELVTRAKRLSGMLKAGRTTGSKAGLSCGTIIDSICERFSKISSILGQSRMARSGFSVKNEYDVQVLFHAILVLFFDDIRLEEWTPSYAGGSGRMDFLLPREKVVIETKMTRPSLKDKRVGDELLIDIARYQQHGGCRTLYCFVYDPGRYITNPRGLEADLRARSDDALNVVVLIRY